MCLDKNEAIAKDLWHPNLDDEGATLTCECGSNMFSVIGLISYHQLYDSAINKYGDFHIEPDFDFPQYVLCTSCNSRMDDEFLARGVLCGFYKPIKISHRPLDTHE